MTAITNTTQLNTFSIIRGLFTSDSTLSKKFKKSNIYEFEPNLKSLKTGKLPYIVISPPSTETDLIVADHITTMKNFSQEITMVMDYDARDNFRTYANAIIRSIENNQSTLESSGYFDARIELLDADVDVLEEKQAIVGLFNLELYGRVTR